MSFHYDAEMNEYSIVNVYDDRDRNPNFTDPDADDY